jgi:hypothetical protein
MQKSEFYRIKETIERAGLSIDNYQVTIYLHKHGCKSRELRMEDDLVAASDDLHSICFVFQDGGLFYSLLMIEEYTNSLGRIFRRWGRIDSRTTKNPYNSLPKVTDFTWDDMEEWLSGFAAFYEDHKKQEARFKQLLPPGFHDKRLAAGEDP